MPRRTMVKNIFVTGDAYAFADGDIADGAVPMSANSYPIWNAVVDFPHNTTIVYKYMRKESDGSYIAEKQNRTVTTGSCNTAQTVHDNITTVSGPSRRSLEERNAFLGAAASSQLSESYAAGHMKGLPGRESG